MFNCFESTKIRKILSSWILFATILPGNTLRHWHIYLEINHFKKDLQNALCTVSRSTKKHIDRKLRQFDQNCNYSFPPLAKYSFQIWSIFSCYQPIRTCNFESYGNMQKSFCQSDFQMNMSKIIHHDNHCEVVAAK